MFFSLGAILYFLIPITGNIGNVALFVIASAIILTMYGGGFATIPAYLRDMFGTMNVGAIHGRLLLAWSAAAIVGPYLVNGLRQSQIDAGVPPAEAYNLTMLIMVGLLVVGFICNLLIRPVDPKFHYNEANTAPGLPGAASTATRTSGD
ncbi:hypothetical protein ACFSC4_23715 [Deinococcus malanensis]|uniref:hypothetical protein n=1 Tax=Deinococcus malanensis TaxID=1706855 RepID=UPI003636B501